MVVVSVKPTIQKARGGRDALDLEIGKRKTECALSLMGPPQPLSVAECAW
jgi:hypothetical protein